MYKRKPQERLAAWLLCFAMLITNISGTSLTLADDTYISVNDLQDEGTLTIDETPDTVIPDTQNEDIPISDDSGSDIIINDGDDINIPVPDDQGTAGEDTIDIGTSGQEPAPSDIEETIDTAVDYTDQMDRLSLSFQESYYTHLQNDIEAKVQTAKVFDYQEMFVDSRDMIPGGVSLVFSMSAGDQGLKAGDYFEVAFPSVFKNITVPHVEIVRVNGAEVDNALETGFTLDGALRVTLNNLGEGVETAGSVIAKINLSYDIDASFFGDSVASIQWILQNRDETSNIYYITLPVKTEDTISVGDEKDSKDQDDVEAFVILDDEITPTPSPAPTQEVIEAEEEVEAFEEDVIAVIEDSIASLGAAVNPESGFKDYYNVKVAKYWLDNNSYKRSAVLNDVRLILQYNENDEKDEDGNLIWRSIESSDQLNENFGTSLDSLDDLFTMSAVSPSQYNYVTTVKLPTSYMEEVTQDDGTSVSKLTKTWRWRIIEDGCVDGYIQSEGLHDGGLDGGSDYIKNIQKKEVSFDITINQGYSAYELTKDDILDHLTFKGYVTESSPLIDPQISTENLTLTDNHDGTYTVTITDLPRFTDDNDEVIYYALYDDGIKTKDSERPDDYFSGRYDNGTGPYGNVDDKAFEGGELILTLSGTPNEKVTKFWKDDDTEKTREERPQTRFYVYRYSLRNNTGGVTTTEGFNWKRGAAVLDNGTVTIDYEAYPYVKSDNGVFYFDLTEKNTEEEFSFAMFPQYDEYGYEYVYFVMEDKEGQPNYVETVDNTSSTVPGEGQSVCVENGSITNTRADQEEKKLTKIWKTAAYQGYLQDMTVVVVLQRRLEGSDDEWEDVTTEEEGTMDEFAAEFVSQTTSKKTDLYDEDGKPYEFRWVEKSITYKKDAPGQEDLPLTEDEEDPYTRYFEFDGEVFSSVYDEEAGIITNRIASEIDYTVDKLWYDADGNLTLPPVGTSITLRLLQNDAEYGRVSITAVDTDGDGVSDGISVEIPETVSENGLQDSDPQAAGYVDASVKSDSDEKDWEFHDGVHWHNVIRNLPKYDPDGRIYDYMVDEVEGYTVTTAKYDKDHYYGRIINSIGEGDPYIIVRKTWIDDSDQEHREDTWVQLYLKKGTVYTDPQTGEKLTASDDTTPVPGVDPVKITEVDNWIRYVSYKKALGIGPDDMWLGEVGLGTENMDGVETFTYEVNNVEENDLIWTMVDENGDKLYTYGKDDMVRTSTEEHYYLVKNDLNEYAAGTRPKLNGVDILTVTNQRVGTVNIEITKTWKDAGIDESLLTEDTFKGSYFALTSDNDLGSYSSETAIKADSDKSEITKTTYDGDKKGTNKYTFESLRKYDDTGAVITYSVEEILSDGLKELDYTSTIIRESAEIGDYHTDDRYVYTATNTRTASTNLSFNKHWDDNYLYNRGERPDLFVDLYYTIETETLENPPTPEEGENIIIEYYDDDGNILADETGAVSAIYYHPYNKDGYHKVKWEQSVKDTFKDWKLWMHNLSKYNEDGAEMNYYLREYINGGQADHYTEYYMPDYNTSTHTGTRLGDTYIDYSAGSQEVVNGSLFCPVDGYIVNRLQDTRRLKVKKIWSYLPEGYVIDDLDSILAEIPISVSRYSLIYDEETKSWSYDKASKETVFTTDSEKHLEYNSARDEYTVTADIGNVGSYAGKPLDRYDIEGNMYYYEAEENLDGMDMSKAVEPLVNNLEINNVYDTSVDNKAELKISKTWKNIPEELQQNKEAYSRYLPQVTYRIYRTSIGIDASDIDADKFVFDTDLKISDVKKSTLDNALWISLPSYTKTIAAGSKPEAYNVTFTDLDRFAPSGDPFYYVIVEEVVTNSGVQYSFNINFSEVTANTKNAVMTGTSGMIPGKKDDIKDVGYSQMIHFTSNDPGDESAASITAENTNTFDDQKFYLEGSKVWDDLNDEFKLRPGAADKDTAAAFLCANLKLQRWTDNNPTPVDVPLQIENPKGNNYVSVTDVNENGEISFVINNVYKNAPDGNMFKYGLSEKYDQTSYPTLKYYELDSSGVKNYIDPKAEDTSANLGSLKNHLDIYDLKARKIWSDKYLNYDPDTCDYSAGTNKTINPYDQRPESIYIRLSRKDADGEWVACEYNAIDDDYTSKTTDVIKLDIGSSGKDVNYFAYFYDLRSKNEQYRIEEGTLKEGTSLSWDNFEPSENAYTYYSSTANVWNAPGSENDYQRDVNNYVKVADLPLQKLAAISGDPLPNTRFVLTGKTATDKDYSITRYTLSDGKTTFYEIPVGEYTLTEYITGYNGGSDDTVTGRTWSVSVVENKTDDYQSGKSAAQGHLNSGNVYAWIKVEETTQGNFAPSDENKSEWKDGAYVIKNEETQGNVSFVKDYVNNDVLKLDISKSDPITFTLQMVHSSATGADLVPVEGNYTYTVVASDGIFIFNQNGESVDKIPYGNYVLKETSCTGTNPSETSIKVKIPTSWSVNGTIKYIDVSFNLKDGIYIPAYYLSDDVNADFNTLLYVDEDGYLASSYDLQAFPTDTSGGIISNTIIDAPLNLTKVDQDGNKLANVEFKLYRYDYKDSDGNPVYTATDFTSSIPTRTVTDPDTETTTTLIADWIDVTATFSTFTSQFDDITGNVIVSGNDGKLSLSNLPYGFYKLVEINKSNSIIVDEFTDTANRFTYFAVKEQDKITWDATIKDADPGTDNKAYRHVDTADTGDTFKNDDRYAFITVKKEAADSDWGMGEGNPNAKGSSGATNFMIAGAVFKIYDITEYPGDYDRYEIDPNDLYLTLKTTSTGEFDIIKTSSNPDEVGAYRDADGTTIKHLFINHVYYVVEDSAPDGFIKAEGHVVVDMTAPEEHKVDDIRDQYFRTTNIYTVLENGKWRLEKTTADKKADPTADNAVETAVDTSNNNSVFDTIIRKPFNITKLDFETKNKENPTAVTGATFTIYAYIKNEETGEDVKTAVAKMVCKADGTADLDKISDDMDQWPVWKTDANGKKIYYLNRVEKETSYREYEWSLVKGTYAFEETVTPDGYETLQPATLVVDENGAVLTCPSDPDLVVEDQTSENTYTIYNRKASIELYKKDNYGADVRLEKIVLTLKVQNPVEEGQTKPTYTEIWNSKGTVTPPEEVTVEKIGTGLLTSRWKFKGLTINKTYVIEESFDATSFDASYEQCATFTFTLDKDGVASGSWSTTPAKGDSDYEAGTLTTEPKVNLVDPLILKKLTLTKQDTETSDLVPGAKFDLYYCDTALKDGKVDESKAIKVNANSYVTAANGSLNFTDASVAVNPTYKALVTSSDKWDLGEGLRTGYYYFVETEAPSGYVLPDPEKTKYYFTVDTSDNDVVVYKSANLTNPITGKTVDNTQNRLEITKQYADKNATKEAQDYFKGGVSFYLKDSEGTTYDLDPKSGEEGVFEIKGLAAGTYSLREILNTSAQGASDYIDISDEQIATVKVEDNGKLSITAKDITIAVNDNVKDIPASTYVTEATETAAATGSAIVTNYKKGHFDFTKKVVDDPSKYNATSLAAVTTALKGAVFSLTDVNDDTNVVTDTAREDGKVKFENLEPGTYTLREVSAPDGYTRSNKTVTVTVAANGLVSYANSEGRTINKADLELDMVNTYDRMTVSATKVWDDNDNTYKTRPNPQTVDVKLQYSLDNGETWSDFTGATSKNADGSYPTITGVYTTSNPTQTITTTQDETTKESTSTTVTWKDLPKYVVANAEAETYTYTKVTYRVVEETKLANYKTAVITPETVDKDNSTTTVEVKNTLDTQDLGIVKTWTNQSYYINQATPTQVVLDLYYSSDNGTSWTKYGSYPLTPGDTATETKSGNTITWTRINDIEGLPRGVVFALKESSISYVENGQTVILDINTDADPVYTEATSTSTWSGSAGNYQASTSVNKNGENWSGSATNEYQTKNFDVTKTWDDNFNRDNKRPTEITLKLYQNYQDGSKNLYDTVVIKNDGTVTSQNRDAAGDATIDPDGKTWKYTWKDLPKLDKDGNNITYSVEENAVANYNAPSGTPTISGGSVSNSYNPETFQIDATKEWSGDDQSTRPDSVKVHLEYRVGADGEWADVEQDADKKYLDNTTSTTDQAKAYTTSSVEQTLNASNNWKVTWADLPIYAGTDEEGNSLTFQYRVVEYPVPTDYQVAYEPVDGIIEHPTNGQTRSVKITNTNDSSKIVSVKKEWTDTDISFADQTAYGYIPDAVVVKLQRKLSTADETAWADVTGYTDIELIAENDWSKTYVGDNFIKDSYDYRFVEVGLKYGETIVPVKDATVSTYTVKEERTVEEKTELTTITNTPTTTEISADKSWNEEGGDALTDDQIKILQDLKILPTEIRFTVYYSEDGGDSWNVLTKAASPDPLPVTYEASTRDDKGDLVKTFDPGLDLPTKSTSGADRDYRMVETALKYAGDAEWTESTIDTSDFTGTNGDFKISDFYDADTYKTTVTNSIDLGQLKVQKIWADENDRDRARPTTINIHVKQDGEELETLTFTLNNGTLEVTSDTLRDCGAGEISADGNTWSYTYTDLPVGDTYTYTVEEDKVNEYTVKADPDAGTEISTDSAITLTNTHVPANITIEATKIWDDHENRYQTRKDEEAVYLALQYKEGDTWTYVTKGSDSSNSLVYTSSDVVQKVTTAGTEASSMDKAIWKDLPVYRIADDSKVTILYRVIEVEEPKAGDTTYKPMTSSGYTVNAPQVDSADYESADDNVAGVEVKNTLQTTEIDVTKSWIDNSDYSTFDKPVKIGFELLYSHQADDTEADAIKWTSFSNTPYELSGTLSQTHDKITWNSINIKGLPIVDSSGNYYKYAIREKYIVYAGGLRTEVSEFGDTYPVIKAEGDAGSEGGRTYTVTWDGEAANRQYDWETSTSEVITGSGNDLKAEFDKASQTIENTEQVSSIEVSKIWNDNYNRDGKRPAAIVLTLYRSADRQPSDRVDTVTLTFNSQDETVSASSTNQALAGSVTVTEGEYDGVKWTYTWTNLPQYGTDGKALQYVVTERNAAESDYTTAIEPARNIDITTGSAIAVVTNTHASKVFAITAHKDWQDENTYGLRPQNVKLILRASTDQGASWADVKSDPDKAYLENIGPDGYASIAGSSSETVQTITYDEATDTCSTVTWNDLPVYTREGKLIQYVVVEVVDDQTPDVASYEPAYVITGSDTEIAEATPIMASEDTESLNVTVQNTLKSGVSAEASKNWALPENTSFEDAVALGLIPTSITAQLQYRVRGSEDAVEWTDVPENGVKTVDVAENGDWSVRFGEEIDEEGNIITDTLPDYYEYRIIETGMTYGTCDNSVFVDITASTFTDTYVFASVEGEDGTVADTTTITNTLEWTDVNVAKAWSLTVDGEISEETLDNLLALGLIPEEIRFQLFERADGAAWDPVTEKVTAEDGSEADENLVIEATVVATGGSIQYVYVPSTEDERTSEGTGWNFKLPKYEVMSSTGEKIPYEYFLKETGIRFAGSDTWVDASYSSSAATNGTVGEFTIESTVTYNAETNTWETSTNNILNQSGELSVTKELASYDTDGISKVALYPDTEYDFYVALFADAEGSVRVSDVKTISVTPPANTGTVTFDNLPPGKYYVFETDEDGAEVYQYASDTFENLDTGSFDTEFFIRPDIVSPDGNLAPIYPVGTSSVQVTGDFGDSQTVTNVITTPPEAFQYEVRVKVTKSLLDSEGNSVNTWPEDGFYAWFMDEDGNPLKAGEVTTVSDKTPYETPAVHMTRESADVTVAVPDRLNGTTITVYETDSAGNPIGASFPYEVSYEVTSDLTPGAAAIVTREYTQEYTVINKEPAPTATPSPAPSVTPSVTATPTPATTGSSTSGGNGGTSANTYNSTSTDGSVKTGDDTPIALYIIIILMAMSAAGGVIIIRKKRENTR